MYPRPPGGGPFASGKPANHSGIACPSLSTSPSSARPIGPLPLPPKPERKNSSTFPLFPALAVRPMRCTYASKSRESVGKSKLTTWPTSGRSRPRDATSVATRTRTAPVENASSARVLAPCVQSPWSSSARRASDLESNPRPRNSGVDAFADDDDDAAAAARGALVSLRGELPFRSNPLRVRLGATKTRVRRSSGRDRSTAMPALHLPFPQVVAEEEAPVMLDAAATALPGRHEQLRESELGGRRRRFRTIRRRAERHDQPSGERLDVRRERRAGGKLCLPGFCRSCRHRSGSNRRTSQPAPFRPATAPMLRTCARSAMSI